MLMWWIRRSEDAATPICNCFSPTSTQFRVNSPRPLVFIRRLVSRPVPWQCTRTFACLTLQRYVHSSCQHCLCVRSIFTWISVELSLWHIWKFSCESHSLKRKLSDVAYTLAHVFTCESQLSEIERVLLLKVFFRKRWAVIGPSDSQHSSAHETPLLTCNFRCSTCKCVV